MFSRDVVKLKSSSPPCVPTQAYSRFVPAGWHDGGIYIWTAEKYLVLEQFWGRAVRASHDSQGSGALLIWGLFDRGPRGGESRGLTRVLNRPFPLGTNREHYPTAVSCTNIEPIPKDEFAVRGCVAVYAGLPPLPLPAGREVRPTWPQSLVLPPPRLLGPFLMRHID